MKGEKALFREGFQRGRIALGNNSDFLKNRHPVQALTQTLSGVARGKGERA